jgi:hypothetical protein
MSCLTGGDTLMTLMQWGWIHMSHGVTRVGFGRR